MSSGLAVRWFFDELERNPKSDTVNSRLNFCVLLWLGGEGLETSDFNDKIELSFFGTHYGLRNNRHHSHYKTKRDRLGSWWLLLFYVIVPHLQHSPAAAFPPTRCIYKHGKSLIRHTVGLSSCFNFFPSFHRQHGRFGRIKLWCGVMMRRGRRRSPT